MGKSKMVVAVALAVVFIAGTGLAQERGGRGGGGRGDGRSEGRGGDRGKAGASMGKRVTEVEGVIAEVGEASIAYQVSRGEKVQQKMIGIADVTNLQKPEWKPIKIKDLQPGDKVLITIYEDPEDPYFPALSVRVTGKGEVKKVGRGR
jgi:hypothetical protein